MRNLCSWDCHYENIPHQRNKQDLHKPIFFLPTMNHKTPVSTSDNQKVHVNKLTCDQEAQKIQHLKIKLKQESHKQMYTNTPENQGYTTRSTKSEVLKKMQKVPKQEPKKVILEFCAEKASTKASRRYIHNLDTIFRQFRAHFARDPYVSISINHP